MAGFCHDNGVVEHGTMLLARWTRVARLGGTVGAKPGGFYSRPPRYCSTSPSVIRHNLSSRHHRYTPSRPLSQYLTSLSLQNVFVQIYVE